MYEVWVSNEDPTFHMVLPISAEKPSFFDPLTWTELGTANKIDALLVPEIRREGFARVRSIGAVFDLDADIT